MPTRLHDSARSAISGQLIDVRALIAVMVLSLATFVQNGYVYPSFLATFPLAMILCGLLFSVAFALWAFIAHRAARPLPTGAACFISAAALVLGGVLWLVGQTIGFPAPLMLASVALISCGRTWAVIMAGLTLTKLPARGVVVTVAAGVGLSYALVLVLSPILAPFGALVYVLLPLVALACVARPVGEIRRASLGRATAPSELALTNPGSFPGPGNRLFVCIMLFEVAFGFSIRFDAGSGTWWQSVVVGVALVLVAVWSAFTRRASREDSLFHLSGLLVVFGFFLSSAQTAFVGVVSQEVLAVGAQTFNVLTWTVLAIIASRNPLGGITALGQGFCASNIGATIGVLLGMLPQAGDALGVDARLLVLAVVSAGFIGYVWIGLKDFSFSAAIQGVKPVEAVAAPAPEAAIETRCAHLASVHGLTEREGEVFVLLARGRNGAFIQEECHVTRNTAKTHIRRIYQKLNVHTQQELIDLVESGRDEVSA